MVRWFKNERLGFSVTYYEGKPAPPVPSGLPRHRAVRPTAGRSCWVIETKGEIRPNTKVKSEAAELWCQRMSTTRYGSWRYLFVQQKRFETALVADVRSLAELVAAVVHVPSERQLKIVPFEEARRQGQMFKTLLPLYGLQAAAGYFGNGEAVEPEGWIEAAGTGRLDERMFVCRAVGRSMEPTIRDGDYLVFRAKPEGTRQGKIVLVQYRGPADPDTGASFAVKRYRSAKTRATGGGWKHAKVTLSPTNPDCEPIVLTKDDANDVEVVAELVTVLR